jgi:hypothetical protein
LLSAMLPAMLWKKELVFMSPLKLYGKACILDSLLSGSGNDLSGSGND